MFTSTGRFSYTDTGLTVKVCEGLSSYYRSTIPPSMFHQRPRWDPHITVVRGHKEIPLDRTEWGAHEGEPVVFYYGHYLHFNNEYYWLNVVCDCLVQIREALGLPPKSRWTRPPSAEQCFHITIANAKFG